jgi:hypothetical protein
MLNKLYELSDTKKIALSIILIAAAAVIIYSNTFHSSFHFDDTPTIVENYAIHRFDVKEIFSTSSRPILDITFALNYYFGKLDVFGYHMVSIMLHIVNGILLYFILLWTVKFGGSPESTTPHFVLPSSPPVLGGDEGVVKSGTVPLSHRMPLYAGLIFIAHPVQTQAVTYIVSRSSVLAATFYLLALFFFIRAFRASNPSLVPRPSPFYIIGAFMASCLGMGTKQETATLPLMLLIYDFYFISRGDWKALKGHYKVHLVMFSTLAIVLYLSFSGLQTYISFDYAKGVPMPQEQSITSFQYFLTQLHVIPYYIKLLFIPTNLNLDYDWPITWNIDLPTILFFVLLTFIVVAAIKLYRKAGLISFGIIWFFVTLSVTSSFIVIFDVIFEHRLYLPSIGFAIVMASIISRISNSERLA